MTYYSYHNETKRLVGVFTPQIDPKASEEAGYTVYMFPSNITEIDPPTLTATQRAYFINGAWVIGNEITVYTKADVSRTPIDVPEREYDTDIYTPLVPPTTNPLYTTWTGTAWFYDEDQEEEDEESSDIGGLINVKGIELLEQEARTELIADGKIYTVNGDITDGSEDMTVNTTTGTIAINHRITGQGIRKNSKVLTIAGSVVSMQKAATETASGRDFTFYNTL